MPPESGLQKRPSEAGTQAGPYSSTWLSWDYGGSVRVMGSRCMGLPLGLPLLGFVSWGYLHGLSQNRPSSWGPCGSGRSMGSLMAYLPKLQPASRARRAGLNVPDPRALA